MEIPSDMTNLRLTQQAYVELTSSEVGLSSYSFQQLNCEHEASRGCDRYLLEQYIMHAGCAEQVRLQLSPSLSDKLPATSQPVKRPVQLVPHQHAFDSALWTAALLLGLLASAARYICHRWPAS